MIERIEREAGVPGLASILSERIPPTDLQSLLLEVARRRAGRRTPADLLRDWERNRLVAPSPVSPRALREWIAVADAEMPAEVTLLDLSPVAPLGACSVVAGVSQDWAVPTVRSGEVVSDSTNVLALECAFRRRALLAADARSRERVRLAAYHRLLRPQHTDDPRFLPHFLVLSLCTAGRDEGSTRFERSALAEQVLFHLRALRRHVGPGATLRLAVTDLSGERRHALVEEGILDPVRAAIDGVVCGHDDERTAGRGYYEDFCFKIHAVTPDETIELADGGSVPWTRRLLSNAKERLVISGVGCERALAARDAAR